MPDFVDPLEAAFQTYSENRAQPAAAPAPAAEPVADPALAQPAAAPAAPASADQPVATEGDAAAAAAAAAPTNEPEPPRDDKGRFVKVAVHAREMAARDRRIDELEQQLAAAKASPQASPANIAAFEALRDKLTDLPPEIGAIIDAVQGELISRDEKLAKMQGIVDRYEQAEAARVSAAQDAAAEEAGRVIEADAVLSGWATEAFPDKGEPAADAKTRWEALVSHDEALAKLPAWRDKPQAARIEEAKRRTAADFGITLPQPTQQAAPAAAPRQLPAAAPAAAPSSLSNITAGRSPEAPRASSGMSFTAALAAARGLSPTQAEARILGGGG